MTLAGRSPKIRSDAQLGLIPLALPRSANVSSMLIGTTVLIGRIFGIGPFKSVLPGLAAAGANTALLFASAAGFFPQRAILGGDIALVSSLTFGIGIILSLSKKGGLRICTFPTFGSAGWS